MAFSLSNAMAWHRPKINLIVDSDYINARFENKTSSPMICWGYVFGKTFSGKVLRETFKETVSPKSYSSIYLFSFTAAGHDL